MVDDAHEERFRQHEEMLQGLARVWHEQHTMNQEQREMNHRLEGFMQRQDAINERLTAAIERLDVTQACIETLLARMIPTGENGREA